MINRLNPKHNRHEINHRHTQPKRPSILTSPAKRPSVATPLVPAPIITSPTPATVRARFFKINPCPFEFVPRRRWFAVPFSDVTGCLLLLLFCASVSPGLIVCRGYVPKELVVLVFRWVGVWCTFI